MFLQFQLIFIGSLFNSEYNLKFFSSHIKLFMTNDQVPSYHIFKTISQGSQGTWMRWHIIWTNIWRMPKSRLSFIPRATYDILPWAQNLTQWYGEEVGCPLCKSTKASLQLILSGCKDLGTFQLAPQSSPEKAELRSWRVVGEQKTGEQKKTLATAKHALGFVKPSRVHRPPQKRIGMFTPGKEWQMLADLMKQLVLQREIMTTTLRTDIVMWFMMEKRVLLIKLTIPWEEGMTAAHERKHQRYTELAAECQEVSWPGFTLWKLTAGAL